MKHVYRHLTINFLIAAGVFHLSMLMIPGRTSEEILRFALPGGAYYLLHFLLSLLFGKYNYDGLRRFREIFRKYFTVWLISSGIALLVLVLYDIDVLPEVFLMVNLFGLITGEGILVFIISFFRESARVRELREIQENGRIDVSSLYPPPPPGQIPKDRKQAFKENLNSCEELSNFVSAHFDLINEHSWVVNSGNSSELILLLPGKFNQIISTHRLDYITGISDMLRMANSRLPIGGLLMVCAETNLLRKKRISNTYPAPISRIVTFFDFIVMQVFPPLPGGRNLNRLFTGGKRRGISHPEILGRLSACGFEIQDEKIIESLLYVVARKINLPVSQVAASYGLIIHLNRIGQHGKVFKFYKIRTMVPFSEYIQEYVYDKYQLNENGKFKDDFRITRAGKFLRKFWIDELPGLWNWIRGDVKLVGVRPLSKHYFSLYSPELQQKRTRFKPGLIPPYYADLPKNLHEIMDSENRYLDTYAKSPFLTDIRYFFRALYNILIKGAKST